MCAGKDGFFYTTHTYWKFQNGRVKPVTFRCTDTVSGASFFVSLHRDSRPAFHLPPPNEQSNRNSLSNSFWFTCDIFPSNRVEKWNLHICFDIQILTMWDNNKISSMWNWVASMRPLYCIFYVFNVVETKYGFFCNIQRTCFRIILVTNLNEMKFK